jgi:hypothetical protein
VLALAALVACGGGGNDRGARAVPRAGPAVSTSATVHLAPTPPLPPPLTTLATGGAASAVGDQLATLEAGLRDPATPSERLPAMGRAHLAAVRRIVQHPDWLPGALARIPVSLRPAVDADVRAQLELQALAPDRTEPPPWRVSGALPADELLGFYREAGAETGVPWEYLAAVHFVETRMGRIRSASTSGALGPMQFLPTTWAAYGRGDVNSDHDAIQAAARYLRANGAPASMASALFHYNRSQHYVNVVTAYAEVLRADARAYAVYYHWPVVVHLRTGDVIMNEGGGVETLL